MNTGPLSSNADANARVSQIHSSATQSLGAEERKVDEEMAREYFGLNRPGREA